MMESNLTIVTIKVYAIVSQGITMSRQGVVGATRIIARTLASIFAQEDTACIDYLLCQLIIVLGGDNQVLRSIRVAQLDSLVIVMYEYEPPLLVPSI